MNCRGVSLNNLARFLVAGIFSLCLASSTLAQWTPTGPPAGAGPPPNNNPNLDDRARQANEGRLRSAELDAAAETENEKHVQAAILNMKQDFARIQVVRNDIARSLVARKPLDYNLIAKQTAEINKRANRLNIYLMAHVEEDKGQDRTYDFKDGEVVGALVKLCKLIDRFTENPALKNAVTVDVEGIEKAREDKAKADNDLLAIIKLSGSIQKKSDSLKPSE
ncbi:MAG: hypothetical protein M3Y84_04020 [Acidobacteriota bacterium]|nr:hypothetical protein [Acidobacteriota bacterium]